MNGPLSDVRVVVLAGMGPTAFASMLLADYGADVIRVTRPVNRARLASTPADQAAEKYDLVNRGIRSVEIDLKDSAGIEAVLNLVRSADVFVEGYRPGVVERLGLDPSILLDENPALVYARLTGFGQDGPMSHVAGHDINYVAQSGVLSLLKKPGQPPSPPMNLLGDYAGGGALAALGVVSAVLHARSTGVGQVVDSSMVEGVAVMASKILGLSAGGFFPEEPGMNYLDGGAPYYNTYECADGRWVAVGAIEENFYQVFLDGLGVDTSDWPAQNDKEKWPLLKSLIGEVISMRTMDWWAEEYAGTDACVSPVLTPEEAATDEHNAYRGVYHQLEDVQHPVPSPRFSGTPARTPSTPSPDLTEIAEVLDEWSVARGLQYH